MSAMAADELPPLPPLPPPEAYEADAAHLAAANPPVSARSRSSAKSESHKDGGEQPFGGRPAVAQNAIGERVTSAVRLTLRSAAQIAAEPQTAVWLPALERVLERNVLALMFGEFGTLKSFLAKSWALQSAAAGAAVVYLHAEGRGLWKRLRAWAIRHAPGVPWQETLERLPFYAIERPINLSAAGVIEHLVASIAALGVTPALIVVDTMSRNSDGTVERSNEDAQIYLNGLDVGLRAVYGCTVLLVSHVGHGPKDRVRGPYSLMANTDANYRVERPDAAKLEIVVTFGRMKDCEPPAPIQYVADVVEVDTDDKGEAVTSLALRATGASVQTTAPVKRVGKHMGPAIAALAEWARAHPAADFLATDDLQGLLRNQGIKDRRRRYDVISDLVDIGLLTPSVGGHRFNRGAL